MIFIGTIIGMVFGFVSRIIIVRYITISEYGLLSEALVLLNIFVLASTLGLTEGITRQIAYFYGRKETKKVWCVIVSAVQIGIVAGLICFFFAFSFSDFISMCLIHDKALSPILKILSIAILFTLLFNIIISVFRGFGIVTVKVYFADFIINILRISFFIAIIYFGLSFRGVVYTYLAVPVIASIALIYYGIKKVPAIVKKETCINPMRKELLYFSLPLFGQTVLVIMMTSTDTLMLGYLKTLEVVGLYNAALPLAHLITIPLAVLTFIYLPIVSQLYSKDLFCEIKRIYAVVTKWMVSATLPIFLMLFLFPDAILNILFGARYMQAGIALQLLTVGFFTHILLGPNGTTLIVMGKTKLVFLNASVRTIMNVSLNLLLIPSMGLVGAAIASAIAYPTGNMLASVELYLHSKTHPFTKNYLKPVVISVTLVLVIFSLVRNIFAFLSVWMLILFFILLLVVYSLSILLTKSFDNDDIMMLLAIEKRLGINATFIKRILRRFL